MIRIKQYCHSLTQQYRFNAEVGDRILIQRSHGAYVEAVIQAIIGSWLIPMQSILNSASAMPISITSVGDQYQAAVRTSLLFPQFASTISRLSDAHLAGRLSLDPALRLCKNGDLESWYTIVDPHFETVTTG